MLPGFLHPAAYPGFALHSSVPESLLPAAFQAPLSALSEALEPPAAARHTIPFFPFSVLQHVLHIPLSFLQGILLPVQSSHSPPHLIPKGFHLLFPLPALPLRLLPGILQKNNQKTPH